MNKHDQMIERSERDSAWLTSVPRVDSARMDSGRLILELSTGVAISLPWPQLRIGGPSPSSVEIMGGGLDVYFPECDEAVFVPDLLAEIANVKQAA